MSIVKWFRTYEPGTDPADAFASAQAAGRAILGDRAGNPAAIAGTILAKSTFEVMTHVPHDEHLARDLARFWIEQEDSRVGRDAAGAIPIRDSETGRVVGWLFVGWDLPA